MHKYIFSICLVFSIGVSILLAGCQLFPEAAPTPDATSTQASETAEPLPIVAEEATSVVSLTSVPATVEPLPIVDTSDWQWTQVWILSPDGSRERGGGYLFAVKLPSGWEVDGPQIGIDSWGGAFKGGDVTLNIQGGAFAVSGLYRVVEGGPIEFEPELAAQHSVTEEAMNGFEATLVRPLPGVDGLTGVILDMPRGKVFISEQGLSREEQAVAFATFRSIALYPPTAAPTAAPTVLLPPTPVRTPVELPPFPLIRLGYKGQLYPGFRGSYAWQVLPPPAGPTHADAIPPNPAYVIPVSADDTLTVEVTAHEATSSLDVQVWADWEERGKYIKIIPDALVKTIALEPDLSVPITFDLPPGIYIVDINGSWDKAGGVIYFFKIEVS